jgi:DNA-directed RNA polymerase subunit F
MITILPQSITTISEAKKLLKDLYDNGESFHPEDDATDLSGDPFTKEEGEKLNTLMEQIYTITSSDKFDPCKYLLSLQDAITVFDEYVIKKITDWPLMVDHIQSYEINPEQLIMNGEKPHTMLEYIGDAETDSAFVLEYSEDRGYGWVAGMQHSGTIKQCIEFVLANF